MYSKTHITAIAIVLTVLFWASCSISLPWAHEPIGQEINLAFVIRNNLVFLPSATIDGRRGQFLLGTAAQHTVVDRAFAGQTSRQMKLELDEKESLRFTPELIDMHGVADAIIGADVWGTRAISIDYASGLITYQKEGIHPELMTIFRFDAEPRVNVVVDGKEIAAIIDTTSPDTLVVPRGSAPESRRKAHLQLAGSDLGTIDIRLADVSAPRIGNRLLSKFLVTIDYGKREAGLWRDPRTR
ncbi:MAG TPA: hypothetical protein VHX14_21940 [Thermoanaerobaculia bacterium]|jgi:hypothetical protein|nr:hypothetical protein [Thermoanaerobaculia bacterium]